MMGNVRVCKTTVTTDGSGNASKASDYIHGEILKISYDKGTVAAGTTCVTTITSTGEQVDSKDVNAAAKAVTYPCAARSGASAGDNKWTNFICSGTLTFTVSSGSVSKTFDVYVHYR